MVDRHDKLYGYVSEKHCVFYEDHLPNPVGLTPVVALSDYATLEVRLAEKEAENERLRKELGGAHTAIRGLYGAVVTKDEAISRTGAVKVKGLEWVFGETKPSPDLSVWLAGAPGLNETYSIWHSTDPNATAPYTVPSLHNGFFDTLDEAKAAAQADYERRIRSALEPAATDDKPIEPSPYSGVRQTFTIPEGCEAVRDENGRATGEVRPTATEGQRVKVPEGQTPLNDDLNHRLLDVINEGMRARETGVGSPYHAHSLEHCLHATGWVQRDLRIALDASRAEPEGHQEPVPAGQHVAYFDDGQFHWMSGIAPRNCELYTHPVETSSTSGEQAVENNLCTLCDTVFSGDICPSCRGHISRRPLEQAVTEAMVEAAYKKVRKMPASVDTANGDLDTIIRNALKAAMEAGR